MMMENKKTVLIIDDETPLTDALRDKLSREGLDVIVAKDGEEGLVEALRVHPDLILLDIMMPKMDGLTMLKKLHEDDWGKSAPVFILTNLSGNVEVSEAVVGGVFDYFVKTDIKIEDLVLKIKDKLNIE